MVSGWRTACCGWGISLNPDWQLAAVLSTPVELLDWSCQGLPADTVSIDSALIATRGNRWPLIIDPQGQASRCWTCMMDNVMRLSSLLFMAIVVRFDHWRHAVSHLCLT
jgi:dynein heavy chain